MQALEKKLISEKEKVLEKHYDKIEKQWKKQSKSFYKKRKAKVVFLKSNGKTVYRGKGVTPLTIKVLKSQKNKTDLTDEFISYADKLAEENLTQKKSIRKTKIWKRCPSLNLSWSK